MSLLAASLMLHARQSRMETTEITTLSNRSVRWHSRLVLVSLARCLRTKIVDCGSTAILLKTMRATPANETWSAIRRVNPQNRSRCAGQTGSYGQRGKALIHTCFMPLRHSSYSFKAALTCNTAHSAEPMSRFPTSLHITLLYSRFP